MNDNPGSMLYWSWVREMMLTSIADYDIEGKWRLLLVGV